MNSAERRRAVRDAEQRAKEDAARAAMIANGGDGSGDAPHEVSPRDAPGWKQNKSIRCRCGIRGGVWLRATGDGLREIECRTCGEQNIEGI